MINDEIKLKYITLKKVHIYGHMCTRIHAFKITQS